MPRLQGRNASAISGILVALATCGYACVRTPPNVKATDVVTPAAAPAAPSGLHFDVSALNRSVDPCSDFYDFACGGWRATHAIPPDRVRWSRYAEITRENMDRERTIVDAAVQAGAAGTPAETRIAAFYGSCMDEAGVEARGLAPLRELLGRIDGVRTAAAAMEMITDLEVHGVRPFFDAYVRPDPRDPAHTIVTIDSGSLGMRSRRNYTSSEPRAVKLRATYREHLMRVFHGLDPASDGAADADRVLALETDLAARAPTPVQARDPDARYHAMTVAELAARYPSLALPTLLTKLGAPPVDRVNVAVPWWMEGANAILSSNDLAATRAYLRALVVWSFAPELPRGVEAERFDFEQRAMRGAREMAPRWQRCMSLLDDTLGEDVGRVFLARFLGDAARAKVHAIVEATRQELEREIAASDWLAPSTRAAALKKVRSLLIVLGGSNRLADLDGLVVDRGDLFGNAWRGGAWRTREEMALLSRPTDRERFFDQLPQTLDGFTVHEMTAVGFTAGFLQPPVFDARMDDAVNFGGLGGVVGHELTHQLDDEGRKFDEAGSLRPWWSADDIAHFEERAQCFVNEYGGFRTEEGTALDGKLSLGENLADNGGLRLAYQTLKPSETGPKVDGFTPAQRFFLAWGQIRCENVTPTEERRQAQEDGHAPGRWRTDGVVRNMPEFATAFSCAPGAPMAPEKRCRLW